MQEAGWSFILVQYKWAKDAVRQGLKMVKLKNVKGDASRELAFGGVLEMNCSETKGIGRGYGDNEICQVLEQ